MATDRKRSGTEASAPDPKERDKDEYQVSPQTDSGRKRPRAFAIISLSLGLLSVPLAAILSFALESFRVVLIGIPFAILGITFGILQVARRHSARVLAYSGIVCSVLALGVSSLVGYLAFMVPATYVEELTRLGYDRSVIDNPIRVELFRTVGQPSAQWIYSGAVGRLGWYSGDQRGETPIRIPLLGKEPTESVSFDPGGSTFGFSMSAAGDYEWYTESARNKDGKSHLKIYPMIVDGREIPNSYLLYLEDYPLDAGPSRYVDFTDLIVRVDGVRPE